MEPLKIYKQRQRGRQDSFWYEGCIAECGGLFMEAMGEITVMCSTNNTEVPYSDVVAMARNDAGLDKLVGDNKRMYWDANNWFEVTDGTQESEVYDTYDAAMSALLYWAATMNKATAADL